MNYIDYKRQVKLAEVLDKPLDGDYSAIDKYVKYLYSLKKHCHYYDDYNMDIIFCDNDGKLVIKAELSSALVLEHNLPKYLFRNDDEVIVFLTELINTDLLNDTDYHYSVFLSSKS